MKKLAALLVIAVLGLAQNASAEECAASSGYKVAMTAIGTGSIWTGCTPTTDDNFTVSGTANVLISGGTLASPIIMNSLTVSGGTLTIAPGAVIQVATEVKATGGTFIMEGRVLYEGEVSAVSYLAYASGIEVTVKGLPVTVAAGQYLVVLDDDPALGSGITTQPTIGAVPAAAGTYRPSYAKWMWFRITNVTNNVLTLDYDEFDNTLTGTYGATASPYRGQRAVPIITAAAHTPASAWTREQYGFSSRLDIAEAACTGGSTTGDCALVDGDLGSMYVQWVSAGGSCEGLSSKIIHVQTDTSLNTDRIWIAGDATGCGTQNIVITNGLRIGDRVAVVSPAQIDGNSTGSVKFDFAAATILANWWRMVRLDDASMAAEGGSQYCNLCFYNSSGNDTNTAAASGMTNGEVAFVNSYTQDTSAVGQVNTATGGATPIGGELWDATGFKFERIYIHDQIDQVASGSGNHGLYHRHALGFDAKRVRISRMGDDLYGSSHSRLGGTETSWSRISDLIAYEQNPATANTDECVSLEDSEFATAINTGSSVRGAIAVGCGSKATTVAGMSVEFSDFAVGGSGGVLAQVGKFEMRPALTPTASFSATYIDDNPNTLKNSVVWLAGKAADTSNSINVAGSVTDSIVSSITDDAVLLSTNKIERTFLDLGGDAQFMSGSTDYRVPQSIVWRDVVANNWRSSAGAGQLVNQVVADNGLLNATFNRVYFLIDFPAGSGILTAGLDEAAQSVTVDGFTIAAEAPTDDSFGSTTPTASGANVTNTCADADGSTLITATTGVGPNADATNRTVPGIGVGPNEDSELRAFANLRRVTVGCEANFPTNIGLAKIAVSHTLLGDLFMLQTHLFSTRDLISAGGGGGGSLPKAY